MEDRAVTPVKVGPAPEKKTYTALELYVVLPFRFLLACARPAKKKGHKQSYSAPSDMEG